MTRILTHFLSTSLVLWALITGLTACQSDNQKLAETSRSPSTRPLSDSNALAQNSTAALMDSTGDQAVVTTYRYSIPPVDETKRDPALQAFVQKVIGYARRHQLKQLLAVADDSIAVSYGGGEYGKQAFKEYLNDREEDSYTRICEVLEMGGATDSIGRKVLYEFPYLQSYSLLSRKLKVKTEEIDAYETYVGLTGRTELYEKPDKTSKLLASLAYPILLYSDANDERLQKKGWTKLKTVDDRIHGYVDYSSVYSLADMTLIIEKKQGIYKIISVALND